MVTHIENIPSSPVVFMRRTGAYGQENIALMENMKKFLRSHNLWSDQGIIYAIPWDNAAFTPPEQCRYDVCFVSNQTINDQDVRQGTLPGGAYIVFQIPHTADAVQAFWENIGSALEEKGKQPDMSRPILERYAFSLVEKGYCEFCLPVFT